MAVEQNDTARVRRNVARMVEQDAPEADIDAYLASEGVTSEQLRQSRPQVSPRAPQPPQAAMSPGMAAPRPRGGITIEHEPFRRLPAPETFGEEITWPARQLVRATDDIGMMLAKGARDAAVGVATLPSTLLGPIKEATGFMPRGSTREQVEAVNRLVPDIEFTGPQKGIAKAGSEIAQFAVPGFGAARATDKAMRGANRLTRIAADMLAAGGSDFAVAGGDVQTLGNLIGGPTQVRPEDSPLARRAKIGAEAATVQGGIGALIPIIGRGKDFLINALGAVTGSKSVAERLARKTIQEYANDPQGAARRLAEAVDDLDQGGYQATTGTASDDVGLLQLEKGLRQKAGREQEIFSPARELTERAHQNEEAISRQLRGVTDRPGTAEDVRTHLREERQAQLGAIEGAGRMDEEALEQAVMRQQDELAEAQAEVDALITEMRTGAAGRTGAAKEVDAVVRGELERLARRKNELASAIDPERRLPVDVEPLRKVVKDITTPRGPLDMTPSRLPPALMARLREVVDPTKGAKLTFGDLQDMRPEISFAMKQAQAADQGNVVRSLRKLRNVLNEYTEHVAKGEFRPPDLFSAAREVQKGAREPHRLAAEVIRRGGIKDQAGEVSHVLGGAKGRPGIINNKNGENLDDIANALWQNGWFPEHATRPTADDLIEALRGDISGAKPRYNQANLDEQTAFENAQGIGRSLEQMGVDPKVRAERKLRTNAEDALRGRMADTGEDFMIPTPEAQGAAARARQFLKFYREEYVPRFREGVGGDIRRTLRKGAEIAPETTAGRFIRTRGGASTAAEDLRRIVQGTENPAEANRAVRDYLVTDFANVAVDPRTGKLNPGAIRKYMHAHGDALRSFPDIRAEIEEMAGQAEAVAGRARTATASLKEAEGTLQAAVKRTAETLKANEREYQKNVAALFLDRDPVDAVGKVFSGADPDRQMSELIAQVRGNQAAHEGLQKATAEFLEKRLRGGRALRTGEDIEVLSGRVLDMMRDPAQKRALQQVFGGDDLAVLERINRQLQASARVHAPLAAGVPTNLARESVRPVSIALDLKFGIMRGRRFLNFFRFLGRLVGSEDIETLTERALTGMMLDPQAARLALASAKSDDAQRRFATYIWNNLVTGESDEERRRELLEAQPPVQDDAALERQPPRLAARPGIGPGQLSPFRNGPAFAPRFGLMPPPRKTLRPVSPGMTPPPR